MEYDLHSEVLQPEDQVHREGPWLASDACERGARRDERWRELRDQLLSYTGASLVFQAIYLFQNVVVARLLGPTLIGLWEALALVTLYNVSHLGVVNAVHREIPIARGRGDEARVAELRAQGLTAALVPSMLVGLGVLAFTGLTWQQSSADLLLGLSGLAILVVVQQLHGYFQVLLRADGRFKALSLVQIALCAGAILHVGLVALLGFAGQVLGVIFVQLAGLACCVALGGYALRPRFERRMYGQLIRIGLPIALIVFSEGVLNGVDRVVIVSLLGTTDLGYYRVAVLASGLLLFLPGILNQMLYPRMGEQYGATSSLRALDRLFEIPTLALATLLPLIIGGIYLVLPSVTALVLPAFVYGVTPARIVVLGLFFVAVAGMAGNVLVVGGRPLEVVAGQLGGAVVKAILASGAVLLGYGLAGAAVGVTLGYGVYGCWMFVRGTRMLELAPREILVLGTRLVLPLAAAVLLAVGLERSAAWLPSAWPSIVQGLVLAAGFGALYCALSAGWLRATAPEVWRQILAGCGIRPS